MSWNHRIMKHSESDGRTWYGLHEVYYNRDGKITCWTTNDLVYGDSMRELLKIIILYLRDFWRSRHRVLDYDMEPEAEKLMDEGIEQEWQEALNDET